VRGPGKAKAAVDSGQVLERRGEVKVGQLAIGEELPEKDAEGPHHRARRELAAAQCFGRIPAPGDAHQTLLCEIELIVLHLTRETNHTELIVR